MGVVNNGDFFSRHKRLKTQTGHKLAQALHRNLFSGIQFGKIGMPVRILGAILNDVPAGAAYRYYSYYLPGYEAVDEDADVRGAVPRVI